MGKKARHRLAAVWVIVAVIAVVLIIPAAMRALKEEGHGFYCQYTVFQEMYRTIERVMERAGEQIYLMLCTIVDSKGNPMRDGQRLNELSNRLADAIVTSVRHSDTVTKYGQGQFLVLLFNTTYENCAIVQNRINGRFLSDRQRTGVQYDVNSVIFTKK